MRLARSIMSRYHTLLTEKHKLTERDIVLLGEHGIRRVTVFDPLLDSRCTFDDQDRLDADVAAEVQSRIVPSVERVEHSLRQSSNISAQELFKIQTTIAECIEYMQQNPAAAAFLNKTYEKSEYQKNHAVNVFYLSLLIGFRMLHYIVSERKSATAAPQVHKPLDLNPLGLGAILIDVGMEKLDHLARRHGPLTLEEMNEVRSHPVAGYKMLPGEIPPPFPADRQVAP